MKRLLIIFLSITLIAVSILSISVIGNSTSDVNETEATVSIDSLNIGDYFTLGKYNDASIIWRYVADDEHGKLIVSDKILCFKPFDENNFWEESYIRRWLNSTVSEGEVNWGEGFPFWIVSKINNVYEKGFMHKSNFSLSEKRVINTVTQWTMLPENYIELATNGEKEKYNSLKRYRQGSPMDGGYFEFYDIPEMPEAYHGAAYKVTDTIFLLDEMQIYHMWENLGDVNAICVEGCEFPVTYTSRIEYDYFLRTPIDDSTGCAQVLSGKEYGNGSGDFAEGIRPAFYLNTDNALILSGSGTADDPYVMNGKEIEVYANCARLNLNDQPTIKDGIVMVPMKETFENLGAKVNWDEEAKSVTIERDGNYIFMMSDNKGIMINGEISDMGYPMTMIDGIAYVPLTALEKSITPNITWDGETQRIDILTK